MKKLFLSTLIAIAITGVVSAQKALKPIYYKVSFPNAVHHEAEIELTVPAAPAGTLKFRMSRSSAGRYATHEFGKNVYNVKASNPDGSPLIIKQTEGDVYEVDTHGDAVKVSYTLFATGQTVLTPVLIPATPT
jgi:predicted metalloprotease with PDZ domain